MPALHPARLALALPALALLGLAAALPAQAQTTVNFDTVIAPADFNQVTPGGAEGPTLVSPTITFTGGVILNDADYNNESTTAPNLYATSDYYPLADGSLLPSVITGTFASPGLYNGLSLDVANGNVAGDFTVTAFSAGHTALATETLFLDDFISGGVVEDHFSLTGSGFDSFTVTSDQPAGAKDFAIDSVSLSAPVPEASTTASFGLLLALGLGGLGIAARRRKTVGRTNGTTSA